MLMDQAKRLTELTGGDALSLQEKGDLADAQKEGGEKLREVVMRLTAQHDTVKDEGTRTRESITDVKNAIQDFSVKLLPLVNTIREAIVEVARWAAPNSNFVKGLDAEKDRISGIERNGRSAIAGFDDGLAKLRAAADKETDPKKKAALLDNISSLESGRALSLKKLREEAAVSGNAELPDSYRKWLEGASDGKDSPAEPAVSGVKRKGRGRFSMNSDEVASVRAAAREAGVDESLALKYVAKVLPLEASAADAVSPKGARGRLQVMPGNMKPGEDPTKFSDNAKGAMRVIKDALARYGDNEDAVLAYYNGGYRQGDAVRNGRLPPAEETRRYLARNKAAGLLNSGGESGPVPGAGTPAAGSGPSKSVVESIITLLDQNGNQRHDPIVQTHFGAPRPAGF
jgi:hypothetical protein